MFIKGQNLANKNSGNSFTVIVSPFKKEATLVNARKRPG